MNESGTGNVYLGREAGHENTIGQYNVFVGNLAGYYETGSNRLYIENSNVSNEDALIYGEFDNNVVRMNGDVGIGKHPGNDFLTNGTTDLDVNGEIRATNFYGNGAGLTGITGVGGASNTGSTTIGADTDQDGVGEIAFQTALETHMTMYNSGEIGMHTIKNGDAVPFTSQTINLEIENNTVQTGDITGLDISLNTIDQGILNTGTATGLKVDVSDANGGGTGDVVAATFVGGNVDIGTTSPEQAKFVVNGDIAIPRANSIYFLESITGITRTAIKSTNTNEAGLGYNALKFYVNSELTDPALVIGGTSNTGNVGIGTEIPTEKLHVGGNILATGSITPDYVFEKYYTGTSELNSSYEFMSLQETEAFIKEHGHLPGVTSYEQTQAQGGILVNKAPYENLEKIEELYLHTIKQQEMIEAQKQSLEALKKQNELLLKRVEQLEKK